VNSERPDKEGIFLFSMGGRCSMGGRGSNNIIRLCGRYFVMVAGYYAKDAPDHFKKIVRKKTTTKSVRR
jgi:hypothetical protein